MSVPSASYSVTMRVTLESHSRIGAVTTAVGDAGGAVTALDVVDPNGAGHDHRPHVQRRRRGPLRAVARRGRGRGRRSGDRHERPHVPLAPGRHDLGRAQGLAQDARRPLDGLHPGRGADLHGHRQGPVGRAQADHQAQHGRRRHRRLGGPRSGQHRTGSGVAGDGGQGAPVQALRRHRRVAGLPRDPGRRRDRAHRPVHRARSTAASTWRTSRRRAASRSSDVCATSSTSRSSTTTSTARPSSSSRPCSTRCASWARR